MQFFTESLDRFRQCYCRTISSVTVACVSCLCSVGAFSASHTIYLLNDFKAADAASVKVHYYGFDSDGNKVEDATKWNQLPMEETGKYAVVNSTSTNSGGHQGAKVFSFSFDDMDGWDLSKGIQLVFIHDNLRGSEAAATYYTDAVDLKDDALYHAKYKENSGLHNGASYFDTECFDQGEWSFAELQNYTIYYVDTAGQINSGDLNFFYWHYNTDRVNAWAQTNNEDNAPYTRFVLTDYVKNIDGVNYPVYQLNFDWELEPEGGYLWKNQTSVGSSLTFTNNGLYTSAGGECVSVINDPETEFDDPNKHYLVYFYDKDGWATDTTGISAHIWERVDKKDTPLKDWASNEFAMVRAKNEDGSDRFFTDFYNQECPVYELEFSAPYSFNITNVIFRKYDKSDNSIKAQTADLTFVDKDMYSQKKLYDGLDGYSAAIYDKPVVETKTIYFYNQDGYDWNETNLNLHFWGDNDGMNHCWNEYENYFKRATDEQGVEINYIDEKGIERPVYSITIALREGQSLIGMLIRADGKQTLTYKPVDGSLYTQGLANNNEGIAYNDWMQDFEVKTIYFYDRESWSSSGKSIAVHYFTSKGEGITTWGKFNATLTRVKNEDGSDAYFQATKDLAYPLFSYKFRDNPDKPAAGLMFVCTKNGVIDNNKMTKDYIFNDGNLYTQFKDEGFAGVEDFKNHDSENSGHPVTAYFYDQWAWHNDEPSEGESATDISLHFWGTNISNDHLASWYGNTFTMERVKNEDGTAATYFDDNEKDWPLYKFSIMIEDDQELDHLIFRKFDTNTGSLTSPVINTSSLVYTENALYTNDNGAEYEGLEYNKWTMPVNEYTVYFADAGGWGPENTQVHIWKKAQSEEEKDEPFSVWDSTDPTMESTGRLYRVGDIYAPVHKYSIRTRKQADGIIFHVYNGTLTLQNDDMDFINQGLYSYYGNKSTPDVTEIIDSEEKLNSLTVTEDEIPKEGKWIYFNIGANQLDRGQWDTPCAKFFKTAHGLNEYKELMPAYSDDENSEYILSKMQMVRPGYYRAYCNDIYRMHDVVFYYYSTSDHTKVNVFPASYCLFDTNNVEMVYPTWTTYVYSINWQSAIQTYCTPERYDELWDRYENNGLQCLYMTGGDLFKDQGVDTSDVRNTIESYSDESLFVFQITIPEEPIDDNFKYYSSLKMSFVCVKDEFQHLDDMGVGYDNVRGWGTFNLGVIGCSKDPNKGWYSGLNDKFIITNEDIDKFDKDGKQQTTRFTPFFVPLNYTIGFNTYNGYEWGLFRKGSLILEDQEPAEAYAPGTYYVAIDTHPEHYTVSFLDFDPMPEFNIVYDDEESDCAKSVIYPFDYTDSQLLHDGTLLNASKFEGDVFFDEVNVVGVNINISSAYYAEHDDSSEADGPFTTKYLINVNGGENVEVEGTGAGLYRLECLPPNNEYPIALRTVYHNENSNQSFCSRVARQYMKSNEPLVAPRLNIRRSETGNGHYSDETNSVVLYDAAIECDYNVDTELAYYPDFKSLGVSSYRLVHSDDWACKEHSFGAANHTKWDKNCDYAEEHNWSKMIKNGVVLVDGEPTTPLTGDKVKNLNILLENALYADLNGNKNESAELTVYAVYPYFVGRVPYVTPLASPISNAPKRAASNLPFDLEGGNFTIYYTDKSDKANFENVIITGVSDITDDNNGNETQFYNMQGIRIANPIPGTPCIVKNGSESRIIIK